MDAAGYVLVVDDDPDMLELLLLLLSEAGYAARSASNGREALAVVAVQTPALILLDMLMPVMDGWQCARALRLTYGRSVPIVVVTAAEHAQARADEIGADDAIAKPFDAQNLLQIVARHITTPAAHP